MRLARAVAVLSLAGACACAVACTAFDFPRPSDTADGGLDASRDVTAAEASADASAGTPFLTLPEAGKLCAQLFRCPHLAESLSRATALPLDTPATPLSFSACMDWVAGPIDPNRVGLAIQRTVLQAVADAPGCSAAYANAVVSPLLDAGTGACAESCLPPSPSTAQAWCEPGVGAFSIACGPPYFGASGDCLVGDAGAAGCVTAGACIPGLACVGPNLLRDCYVSGAYTEIDCSLQGRTCSGGLTPNCVVPSTRKPPCTLPHERRDDCDGTAVRHCTYESQTELDCLPVGRDCVIESNAARCHGATDRCTPFDATQSQCSGDGISVCIGGVPGTFDCTSIGARCVPGDATSTPHCGAP